MVRAGLFVSNAAIDRHTRSARTDQAMPASDRRVACADARHDDGHGERQLDARRHEIRRQDSILPRRESREGSASNPVCVARTIGETHRR